MDHIRAATFIMADEKKIAPSNVEHGYIVRRLIRRAIRQANLLNINQPILTRLSKMVINTYKDVYSELETNKDFILTELENEEKKFQKSLRTGLRKFRQILRKKNNITGEDAFLLFTSFGFPVEKSRRPAPEIVLR